MNLSLLLEMAASALEERTAVVAGSTSLTYGELDAAARRLAARFLASEATAVLYLGPSDPTFAVTLFAAAYAGLPFCPLNYRLGAEQLRTLVASQPGAAIVSSVAVVPGAEPGRILASDSVLAPGQPAPDVELPAFVDPDDVAILLYTSGTSGTPKAAMLRHRHLTSYVLGTVEFADAAETDASLVTVPPYHIAGVANLLTNVYGGRRIVYLDAFDAEGWLDTVRRQQVTQAMVVPTMLARIVAHLGDRPADVPTLRTLSYGGARTPLPVLERAYALFPSTGFVNAYGLTETSSTIALLDPEDHRRAFDGDDPEARRHLQSVGKLLPGIEVEVRDDDGLPVASGATGLVFLRGPQISGEYDQGSVLDAEGWFPTRDRGSVDEDGYLFIEGRADDTIIRGGENIAPAEIEDVLVRYPGVAEAVVVGVPDDEWGQRIAAVVVMEAGADATPDELRAWCREHLRSSKTPEVIELRTDLPRTATGKVVRREVHITP